MELTFSEVESKRFGLRIFRAYADEIDEQAVLTSMSNDDVDVAFIRIPSGAQASVARLTRVGLPHLVADTLVEYTIDLVASESPPLRNQDLIFREADSSDRALVSGLVAEIFPGYTNHYYSNPLLEKDDILAGYQEWATNYIATESTSVFLASRDGQVIGFATCRWSGDDSEGVLYGVRPTAAGSGVYGDMIRFTQDEFKRRGMKTMLVSTQVQNLAVQKAWIRAGFSLHRALTTVHVNAMFGTTKRDPVVVDLPIDRAATEAYAELTGDRNPLHFDPEYARERGFDADFAHGLVANGVLSQVFGMVAPGPGTVFLGYQYRFFRPLYYGRRYNFTVTFPIARPNGFHMALVRAFDESKQLCLVAYCDLHVQRVAASD